MKAILAVCLFAACLLGGRAWASSARFGDADLVEHSDLIVSATLVRVERAAGILEVHQVLKGAGQARVLRLALPDAAGPRSSSDIDYRAGQKGLWFLRATPEADGKPLYRADHPQRFLREEEAAPRLRHFQDLVKARQR